MSGPYAQAAGEYWAAGWRGVLPLPPRRKKEPPTGFTGWNGIDPSWPDVMTWAQEQPDGNVALHLPDGVLGIDVDNYAGKIGGETLELRERAWGALPPTWRTTSRDDGISGIRFYRAPVPGPGRSLRWPGKVGPGIETVHRGHRYAVVPPSIHPDTERAYRWITPEGAVSLTPPRVEDLPELPWPWVVGLTEGREHTAYAGADMSDDEIKAWLESHYLGDEPCPRMAEHCDRMRAEMPHGAHESLSGLMGIVRLAGQGHHGLRKVLSTLRIEFLVEVRERRQDEDEAASEWRRSLFGAVDKIAGELDEADADIDPCDVFDGLLVSPAPGASATPTDIPSGPAPGSASEPSDDTPSDELSDEGQNEGKDAPRVLTPEEREELAIAHELTQLRRREKAKQRLQAENAPPFRALGFGEFKLGPEPEPVVPGLLYRDSLSRIFGAPGCGKSFLALDLAFSVALGKDWAGETVTQTSVAYVMAEGQRVNKLRAEAWQERHGVSDEELEGCFYAVPDALALAEAAIGPFVAWVREQGIGLVVLDTKNAMQVGEENSATDAALMRRALDAIRKATDACVVLIDHTGKNDLEEARGSSAVKAAMDTEIKVDNDGKSPAKVTVTVSRDKAAEAGRQWELMLRMAARAAVLLPLGEDVGLPAPRPLPGEVERAWLSWDRPLPEAVVDYAGPGRAAVPDLARFMAHDAGAADPDDIGVSQAEAKAALSVKALGKTSGHSPAAVRRAWSALRAMGYLAPADGKDGSDGKVENTTGKHVWTARGGV